MLGMDRLLVDPRATSMRMFQGFFSNILRQWYFSWNVRKTEQLFFWFSCSRSKIIEKFLCLSLTNFYHISLILQVFYKFCLQPIDKYAFRGGDEPIWCWWTFHFLSEDFSRQPKSVTALGNVFSCFLSKMDPQQFLLEKGMWEFLSLGQMRSPPMLDNFKKFRKHEKL